MNFKFYKNDPISENSDTYNAIILPGIHTKHELLLECFKVLKFPDYFGFNWDALKDCLCDLSWIRQHGIHVIHDDLPLTNLDERRIYLEILNDVMQFWEKDGTKSFEVFFPSEMRSLMNI